MNENPAGTPIPGPTPGNAPVASPGAAASPATPESNNIANVNPADSAPAEPVKKKRTGLIIGIIIGIVVLIGGAVALALVLPNLNKGDAVTLAMQKIMTGNAPTNVAIDGEFNFLINQEGTPIKRVNINLDTDIMTGSMINTSSAVLTFTTYENKDYSIEFDEIYAADGNVYFKIDGATAALEDSDILDLLMMPTVKDCYDAETDCADAADCISAECITTEDTIDTDTESENDAILDVIESIDGVWIKISSDMFSSFEESFDLEESPISCVTDLVTKLNKNSNTTADLYNKYPFITSTTKDVIIPSKNSQVYLIGVDSEEFTSFANSISNPGVVSDLYTCFGYESNTSFDEDDIKELLANLPKVYAEINGNNDFSRLYLESDINNGDVTLTIDLGFEYPSNVNVTEPVEYTDFTKIIKQLFSGFYELSDTEPAKVEVEN